MPVKIIFCYAHEEEVMLDQLQKHLKSLKWQGLVELWDDRNISPGALWEDEIRQHLYAAKIILLLVSPTFMASEYCYNEMQQAVERHKRGEVSVIPIILCPFDWQGTPFSKLQVLPTNAKPVTTWSDQNEAFLDVARGVRKVVWELISQVGGQQHTLTKKRYQRPQLHFSQRRTHQLVAGLVMVAGSASLLGWTVTQAQFSQKPQRGTLPQSAQDQNLLVQFLGTQQSAINLPSDPAKLSPSHLPKQEVPALCIDQQKQPSVFRITVGISNLRRDQYTLLIQQVQLVVEQITPIPRPLYALVQNLPVLSSYNLYRATYMGQNSNTSIHAKYDNPPYDYVFLTLNETDKLSIQVASSVEVFLSFRVAITYRVANEGQTRTLTLPNIFQVIFTDKSNWHLYQVQDEHFIQLDGS